MEPAPPVPAARGTLYVVATPIGNLEDIGRRALRVLGEVDLIACEDTRRTVKILNRHGIRAKLTSYYQGREKQKAPVILRALEEGRDVALVSDAGTPAVSDPGFSLVRDAVRKGIRVVPVPGPCALTAALCASGLPTHRFLFVGFPPPKAEALKKWLKALEDEEGTLALYLPARKVRRFLEAVFEILGDREVVLAREITKIHEEFRRGTVKELLETADDVLEKGELTVLIHGR
ncbi:MAG: 16S rRNA (cytidine(1402)-2'-O)-methyltransferase [Candidatus Aminicenantes bacterium]|nr:16S rRNA (cytidine(1402)-2'-O)-methyltransferase [Candidatus Aminicenantes bacterium]